MHRLDLGIQFQDYFVKYLKEYINENNTTQKEIARLVGISEPNLSNLVTKESNGKYLRPLTAIYLHRFRSIFNMAELAAAWHKLAPRLASSPSSKRIDEFWEEMELTGDVKLMRKLRRAKELGLDLHSFLDGYIQSRENQKP